MSILHKGSSGKAMAAMPDVCKCPPTPPAGPIPTPLPNNAMASDLQDGASSVKIGDNPVGTKASNISTSTGNEASQPTGGGLVSNATKGKVYPASFSFDVKAEGNGVWRHLDIGTHNHNGPQPGNTPPWPMVAKMAVAVANACAGNPEDPCKLTAYKDKCPEGRTPHHAMPAHGFLVKAEGMRALNQAKKVYKGQAVTKAMIESTCPPGCKKYRVADAPCICVTGKDKHHTEEGSNKLLQHGWIHRRMDLAEAKAAPEWSYAECRDAAIKSIQGVLKGADSEAKPLCSEACLKAQLDDYHVSKCGIGENQKLRADKRTETWMSTTEKEIAEQDDVQTLPAAENE